MCFQYLFNYMQCGCRKALWERVPCKYVGFCEALIKRDVAIEGSCTSCRKAREEQRRVLRERLLDCGRDKG